MTMRAAVLHHYERPLVLQEVRCPDPEPGQVLVRVRACGVCGSDLFLRSGGFKSVLPIIPGHEVSGEVVRVGAGVESFQPRDRVLVYVYLHCGQCLHCRSGQENICVAIKRIGVDLNGAFAEYLLAPESNLIPLPTDVGFLEGAVLTDAVATPYHALHDIARVDKGETVAVFGVGGIGSNAVQVARLSGARVLAVEAIPSKLQLAKSLGAEELILNTEDVVARIQAAAQGLGADVCIQCVGDAAVDELAIRSVRKGGRVILVGASTKPFQVTSVDFIWRELKVFGSRGFTKRDIAAVLEAYRRNQLRVDHLLQSVLPLEEANHALDLLAKGEVMRSVLVPSS